MESVKKLNWLMIAIVLIFIEPYVFAFAWGTGVLVSDGLGFLVFVGGSFLVFQIFKRWLWLDINQGVISSLLPPGFTNSYPSNGPLPYHMRQGKVHIERWIGYPQYIETRWYPTAGWAEDWVSPVNVRPDDKILEEGGRWSDKCQK